MRSHCLLVLPMASQAIPEVRASGRGIRSRKKSSNNRSRRVPVVPLWDAAADPFALETRESTRDWTTCCIGFNGPPLLAPLLFANVAVFGVLALLDPHLKSDTLLT